MKFGSTLGAVLLVVWAGFATGCGPTPSGDAVGLIEDLADTTAELTQPSIIVEPRGGELPLTATFRVDAPIGAAFGGELLWEFGDGALANGLQATHTFDIPGTYQVTVGTNDVLSPPVFVPVIPDLDMELDPNALSGGIPWTFGFRAITVDPQANLPDVAYDWRLNGQVIAEGTAGEVTIREAGRYTLGLFVTVAGITIPCAERTLEATSPDLTASGGPPVAVAGPDQQVAPGALVTLDGSESSDPAGLPLDFEWEQESGPAVDLVFATGPQATFTAPNGGTMRFKLTVSNGTSKAEDFVSVQVQRNATAPSLHVTNNAGLIASGIEGGPFTPPQITYTLSNLGEQSLAWQAQAASEWITLSKSSGTLVGGGTEMVVVTVGPAAELLEAGLYTDSVSFLNLSNGEGDTSRQVALTVNSGPDALQVTPEDEQVVTGEVGGPFAPQTIAYTVTNTDTLALDWSVTRTAPWITLSRASGTLAAGDSETVIATINAAANNLVAGNHSNELVFVNETDETEQVRSVLLMAAPPAGVLAVTPAGGLTSSGPQGGPFSPTVKQFTLSNAGGAEVKWQASKSSLWVVLSETSGTLQAGESTTVNVLIGVIATTLPPGTHTDTVNFVNTSNGNGSTSRDVTITVNAPGGALQVSPAGGFESTGNTGGPFSPSSRNFTLTNNGGTTIAWLAENDQPWVSLSQTTGSLAPGASTVVTASLNATANGLGAGTHNDTISFLNMSTGDGSTTRAVTLTVTEPAALVVSPSAGLVSSGDPGGPFTPDSRTYTLNNTGGEPLTYQVSKSQNWVSLSRTSGTLPPGTSTTVTVSINGNADALASNSYADTVAFANLTNGSGDTVRSVNLTVNDPPGQLAITPASGVTSSGPVGGPFNPVGKQYTLSNTGGISLNWSVSADQNWISMTPTSGQIAPGGSTIVTVSVNSNAEALAAGTFNGLVSFSNDMNASGSTTRPVTLTVQNAPALAVTPGGPLSSSGLVGGPFSPSSKTYTLTNTGDLPLNFAATRSAAWVSLSQSAGTLNGGESTTVIVSLNGNADGLAAGSYSDSVTFANNTNGTGDASRAVNLTVTAPAAMALTPADGLTSSGSEGGPFSPDSRSFTITNTGGASLAWSVSKSTNWVTLSQTSGTLAGGASTIVVASLNANADNLSAGIHGDTLTFTNVTNGTGNASRPVALTVRAAGTLSVTPGTSFASSGPEGGPFNPASRTYTLTNSGDDALNWTAADNANWVAVSPTSGSLAGGASTTVTVSLTAAADSLAPATHNASVTFTNTTNGNGNATRGVSLSVTGDCATSDTSFASTTFAAQSGLFSATFDVTPNGSGIDGLTLFSSGAAGGYGDMAAAVRFNTSGTIDARDGGGYGADQSIAYASGATYHVRMSINVLTRTYSVYVTPPGGSEQILAVDYAFRTEQAGVTTLDNWALQAGGGSHEVCNMTIEAGANQAPAVSAGGDLSTALPDASVDLDGTVSDDGLPNPPGAVTATWSKVSGPGTVTFGSTSSVDTTADFSAEGTYVLRLSVTDGDLSASDELTVTVSAPPPPALEVSTGSLNFGSSSTSLTFTVRNAGSGTLSYAISDNASWLSVSPTSGSSTGEADTITVSADRSGLADGSHNATITINPDTGANQTIAVTLLSGTASSSMSTASRASGMAPLAVFFDAVTADNGVVQPALVGGRREYADLHYAWDFGDPGSGNWSTDGKPRNAAIGYCAAHVFEDPGTYTVTLTVTDPATMQTSYYTQQITVTAFSGTTYYVSNAGSDGNNGLSPTSAFQSIGKAMSMAGPNTRILFKRGDTWTGGSGITVSVAGPGIIGAYANSDGSDDPGQPRPKIVVTGSNSHGLRMNGNATDVSDWRVMDLELQGPNGASAGNGVQGEGTMRQLTLLRLDIHDFYVGILNASWSILHEQNAIVDSNIHHLYHNATYVGGAYYGILGSRFEDVTNEHALRMWHMRRTAIAHNVFGACPRHQIKLHNNPGNQGGADEYQSARHIVFTDNQFVGSGAWSVTVGPQDEFRNEIVRDILFERNTFTSTSDVQAALSIWAQYVTVRNNVFDARNSSRWYRAIRVSTRGVEPTPQGNRILNNTAYRSDGGDIFMLVDIGNANNTLIRNNIASAPNSDAIELIRGSGTGLVADHNLYTESPGFTNPAAGDFHLTAGSPGVDAGMDVGILLDFDGQDRLIGSNPDLGAFERQP